MPEIEDSCAGCPMCVHEAQQREVADGTRCGGCWSLIAAWDSRAVAGRCGNCVDASRCPSSAGAQFGQGRTE